MKLVLLISLYLFPFFGLCQQKEGIRLTKYPPVDKVRAEFRALLKRPAVDPKPSFQTVITDSVLMEKGFIYSEATEKVPVLIYKPVSPALRTYPVVICLHGTGGSKDDATIRDLLYRLSKNGIMGVAIDARYHGERVKGGAHGAQEYVEAIIRAWKNTDARNQEYPFYFDTVYDLWKLTDYLVTRKDVQANRIGMMGISMGIQTWMAASADQRIKVAVPVIAAQSFQWSLENNSWQGRAKTIWEAHRQAAIDLGDSSVNKENVRALWAKLLPGITGKFDCPSMIRLFAPRPLLLLNNEKDVNCPLPGAQLAFEAATRTYKSPNAVNKLKIHVTPGEPHRFLPEHVKLTMEWFKKWL
jgi:dienelactone hydrolase